MASPPIPAHRGRVPWQGLLLAVSLLIFWSPPASAQLSVQSINTAEGKTVVLRMLNRPPRTAGFVWYKGLKTDYRHFIVSVAWHIRRYRTGPEYNGRQVANLEGSLIINKVDLSDSGIYTVIAYLHDSNKEIGFGHLNVYQPVRMPTLLATNTEVTEQKDSVVMTCYTDALSTHWLFNAEHLTLRHDRMKLSDDHKTLTIDPVRREDSGNYQCKVSNPISSIESAPVELDVNY
ncbi:carcinoembryonic antigen-related cell adhesion molecule 21-like [Molossus molossus]|uniref:CEA cell adhesion molecule 21 n=1 Tax=Molossus molossus TaxID=27622 RepID=A0A7J8C6F6_MOLMO|nr:carcinoembryonic antigen-related cell adhesion molecule 21-like [Molossus molossus]KAF6406379.1 CEA cell adhesion molecule 21 [Molossus molossus]